MASVCDDVRPISLKIFQIFNSFSLPKSDLTALALNDYFWLSRVTRCRERTSCFRGRVSYPIHKGLVWLQIFIPVIKGAMTDFTIFDLGSNLAGMNIVRNKLQNIAYCSINGLFGLRVVDIWTLLSHCCNCQVIKNPDNALFDSCYLLCFMLSDWEVFISTLEVSHFKLRRVCLRLWFFPCELIPWTSFNVNLLY